MKDELAKIAQFSDLSHAKLALEDCISRLPLTDFERAEFEKCEAQFASFSVAQANFRSGILSSNPGTLASLIFADELIKLLEYRRHELASFYGVHP